MVVVMGELVAPCPTPPPLASPGGGAWATPVTKSRGCKERNWGKKDFLCPVHFGGVWGSEKQWSLCPQPLRIWPWVWLGPRRQVLFEVTLSKLSLNL